MNLLCRARRLLLILSLASNLAIAVCPASRHETTLAGYALSPDGTRIAAVGNDGAVFWWNVSTGKRTQLLDCVKTTDYQHPILFSPDSAQVAIAVDQSVEVFDLSSGKLAEQLIPPNVKEVNPVPNYNPIYNLGFSGNGERLAASYETGVTVWDLNSKHIVASIEANPERNALALNDDGTLLLLGCWDGVELWTLRVNGSTRRVIENITAEAVLFAHDDQWIVALTATALPVQPNQHYRKYKREIGIWDRTNGKRLRALELNGPLEELEFGVSCAGSDRILASDFKQHLYLWDLATGALKGSWKTPAGHPSPDGTLLLRPGGLPGQLQLWEIGSPDSDARNFVYKSSLCAPGLRDANGNVRFEALGIADGQSADDEPFGSYSNIGYVARDCTPVGLSHLSYKTEERALKEMRRQISSALEIMDAPLEHGLHDSVLTQRVVLRVPGLTPEVGGFSILRLQGKSLIEIYSTSLPAALAMEKQQREGK